MDISTAGEASIRRGTSLAEVSKKLIIEFKEAAE